MSTLKQAVFFCQLAILATTPLNAQDQQPLRNWLNRQTEGEALAFRFAVEPFFGSPFLRIAKFDARMPRHIAPSQFRGIGADQVVIHARESVGVASSTPTSPGGLSWAAVARLREPLSIEEFVERWLDARIVRGPAVTPESLTPANGRAYYRVPSGTFLGRPVRSGMVQFEDSKGVQIDGINVGDVDTYYSYVGHEGNVRAVVDFFSLSDRDFSQGHVELALRCPVFQTRFRNFEDAKLSAFVRNPATGLRSESFEIAVTPDHEVRFLIPSMLKSHEGPNLPLLDLREDLISEGRLQLCFSLAEPSVYCGFGDNSVQIVHERYEFVHLVNDLVFVSDSEDLLNQLLDDDQSVRGLLAHTEPTAELSLRLNSSDDSHLLEDFAVEECGMIEFMDRFSELIEVNGTMNFAEEFQCHVSFRYASPASAAAQIDPFVDLIAEQWTSFCSEADLLYKRSRSIGNLVQAVFDGVRATFPQSGMSAKQIASVMSSYVGGPEDVPRMKLNGSNLEISFAQPDFHFSESSQKADFLANVLATVGFDSIRDKHIEQAENSIRLALDQMPDDTGLTLRLSHLYCFNAPREWQAAEIRYAMVRKGIDLVLDSLERTSKDSDKFWLLARILHRKVADPLHEAGRLRPLFIGDSELQKRIQKVCGFQPKENAWDPDPSAVAERLLNLAIQLRESTPKNREVPLVLIYSDRAFAAVGSAEHLMRSGQFDAAETAWAKASDFFDEVANKPVVEVNQKAYRLFDLPEVRKSNAADADRIEPEYDRTECMHGFSICEVASTPLLRDAMKTIHDATKHGTSTSRCLELYESAFQKLGEAFRKQEEQLAVVRLLAPEWQDYDFRRMKTSLPENESTKAFREMQQSYSEYGFSRMQTLLKNHQQGER